MNASQHRVISISGDLGSGKSTVTALLAERLGWRSMSTGEMQRSIAAERNLTTLELNHLSEQDFSVDSAVDAALKSIGEKEDSIVLDSRMAWLFVPTAFSAHITVRPDVGDRRLLGRSNQATERYTSSDEAQRQRVLRARSERERFQAFYSVDIQRLRNYDIVVDSTSASPADLVDVLERGYATRATESGVEGPMLWLSPLNLLPSELITTLRGLDDQAVEKLSQEEYLSSHPIEVIYSYPYFMVVDGHKRLSSALIRKLPLVPARLVAEGAERAYGDMTADMLFTETFRMSQIFDWESVHSIDYGLDSQRGYLDER